MTKTERIEQLVESAKVQGIELKKSEAEKILSIVDNMQVAELLEKGVATTPFGNLKITYRAAKEGRNPRTKETIQIPAKLGVKLSTTKAIKDGLAQLDVESYNKN